MNSKAEEKGSELDCEYTGDRTILLLLVQDPSDWFGHCSKIAQDSASSISTFSSSHWAVCSRALHSSDRRGDAQLGWRPNSIFHYTHLPRILCASDDRLYLKGLWQLMSCRMLPGVLYYLEGWWLDTCYLIFNTMSSMECYYAPNSMPSTSHLIFTVLLCLFYQRGSEKLTCRGIYIRALLRLGSRIPHVLPYDTDYTVLPTRLEAAGARNQILFTVVISSIQQIGTQKTVKNNTASFLRTYYSRSFSCHQDIRCLGRPTVLCSWLDPQSLEQCLWHRKSPINTWW